MTDVAIKARYHYVRRPGHVLVPPSGTVPLHRLLLFEKIGYGPHLCHWCSRPIAWKPGAGPVHGAIVADHVDGDKKHNVPENIVESCTGCNTERNRTPFGPLVSDDELYRIDARGYRHRQVARECEHCGSGFTVDPDAVRRGAGRFCTRSCARRHEANKRRTG